MLKRVKGLDGREYPFSLNRYTQVYKEEQRKARSKYHKRAREAIINVFPGYILLEEVKLPGSGNLFLDFLLPNLDIGIEVHGQQHYKYTPFFHKNKLDFLKAQARDTKKQDWCNLNNINLVTLKYSENIDEWTRRLQNRETET